MTGTATKPKKPKAPRKPTKIAILRKDAREEIKKAKARLAQAHREAIALGIKSSKVSQHVHLKKA